MIPPRQDDPGNGRDEQQHDHQRGLSRLGRSGSIRSHSHPARSTAKHL
jgi:hypothetical protein